MMTASLRLFVCALQLLMTSPSDKLAMVVIRSNGGYTIVTDVINALKQ